MTLPRSLFVAVLLCAVCLPAMPAAADPDHGSPPPPPIEEKPAEKPPAEPAKPEAEASATQPEKAETPKWDVNAPAGAPLSEASIDTAEGTWMSLDVSPDGKEIVFDLLGDI